MTETLQIHPVVMSQATKKQHRLSMLCSKATVSVMTALCTGKIRAFWYLVMTLLACWLLALLLIFRFCASVYSLRPRRLALLRSNHYGRGLGFTSFVRFMVSLVMSMSTDLKSVLHSRLTEFLTAGIPR
jgi:hypothetical protein